MKNSIDGSSLSTSYLLTKIQRGFYMGGYIASDQKLCKCGGKWTRRKSPESENITVPVCTLCGSYPTKLRVRRYLPPVTGTRGETSEIRYDQNGKRLTKISQAIVYMESLDHDLKTGNYDAKKIFTKKASNLYKFSNYIEAKYWPYYESKLAVGEITENTMRIKRQLMKNHLMPFFRNHQIDQITTGVIEDFYYTYRATLGQRDMATQELKVIIRLAHRHDLITKLPSFPKFKKKNFRNPEMFLTSEQQDEILGKIDNYKHRAMIEILCIYGIRPCEVRALKWKDLDFNKEEFTINRHCTSGNIVIDGRKSDFDCHTLPMVSEFKKIIDSLGEKGKPDEYIFKGDILPVVSERVLLRAWQRAIKLTEIPYVDLYSGTKHSRLSGLLRAGATEAEIQALTGHKSISMVKRYAQLNKESKMRMVKNMLGKSN